jgi:hypothetical protein
MGRRPLTEDRRIDVLLDARSGVLAIQVVKGEVRPERAVAELALIAACRADLVDEMLALVRRARSLRVADWPPVVTTLMLLERTRRVTLGDVALVGPGGVRIEQVTLTGKSGGPPVRYLRLRRHGSYVGDYRTVEQLAKQIDISTLVEELEPQAHQSAT